MWPDDEDEPYEEPPPHFDMKIVCLIFCAVCLLFTLLSAREVRRALKPHTLGDMLVDHMEPGHVYKVVRRPDGVIDMRSTAEVYAAPTSCSTVITAR